MQLVLPKKKVVIMVTREDDPAVPVFGHPTIVGIYDYERGDTIATFQFKVGSDATKFVDAVLKSTAIGT